MKQIAPRHKKLKIDQKLSVTRVKEGAFIGIFALATFLLIALGSYHVVDPGWSHIGGSTHIANAAGKRGAWLADLLLYFLGYTAYLLPLVMAYAAWVLLRDQDAQEDASKTLWILRGLGFLFLLAAGSALGNLAFPAYKVHLPAGGGGVLGYALSTALSANLSVSGSIVLLFALVFSSITLLTGWSWLRLIDRLGYVAWCVLLGLREHIFKRMSTLSLQRETHTRAAPSKWREPRIHAAESSVVTQKKTPAIHVRSEPELDLMPHVRQRPPRLPSDAADEMPVVELPRVTTRREQVAKKGSNGLPPLSLLDKPEHSKGNQYSSETLELMSRQLEERLHDFGVEVQVVAVHPGPVITRFELQLAPGLKVSKISSLAKDLARSLSVLSVRVVEVIPGKSVIGIELPNQTREMVRLSETLASTQYQQARSPLSLALGKDIAGHPVVMDLAKMPHLLVAGTTGAGKSVGLNAMILSLLYKASAAEVRLILIDPKMLELSIYADIPHLLTPVVTDMKDASNALRWCVAEMDRRYKIMSLLGVRNLAGYNSQVTSATESGKPLTDPMWPAEAGPAPALMPLPCIVVVIDELADMMIVVGKKVESLIARIAQKARAAGIHMILATQRPSVDVLTGLIKANIPTRIAFQVSSKIDSRTILDQQGAEQLLGHGDMLYLAPGAGIPTRVHGAFVSDHEVHQVVNYLRQQGKPDYLSHVVEEGGEFGSVASGLDTDEDADPLYDQAVEFVLDTRRASISAVQRRLKIGYNRAARMIEQMEKAGLVSAMEGNGNREVLVPAAEER